MNATDLLRMQMDITKQMTVPLLEDLADAPLATPLADGGNHALWIAGHVVFAEARLTSTIMFGTPSPLETWGDAFGRGTQPQNDQTVYPASIPEILAKWNEVRENTLAELAKLSDDDLDQPVAQCPAGREMFFGTFGKALNAVAHHPHMHRGQLADIRRALGRQPLQA